MARTYFHDFLRDDGETEVTAEYSLSGGCAAHMGSLGYPGHPAEAPEVELLKVFSEAMPVVNLTDAELERLDSEIYNNLPEDDGDDYDY